MDFQEKFYFEDNNQRNIYLHVEGPFFCMYNQSAYLFLRDIRHETRDGKPIKVSYGIVKKLNREYFRIGIPTACLRDFFKSRPVHDIPGFNSRLCHAVLERDLDEGAYTRWCDEVRQRGIRDVTPSRMQKLLSRQPFRATARDIFLRMMDIVSGVDKHYVRLSDSMYGRAEDIYLGCVKFFKAEDRAAEAARLVEQCWNLEALLLPAQMKHLLSPRHVSDLGEQLDSLRRQLSGLGSKAKATNGKESVGNAFKSLESLEPDENAAATE